MPARQQSDVRSKLAKAYTPTAASAKLVTSFDCDPVGRVREVVYEEGSGHGQDLALVRLRRQDRRIEALRITRPSYLSNTTRDAFRVERGELDGATFDALLPAVRGLLLAKLTEKVSPDEHSRSGFFSSSDMHSLVRLEDEAGHALERGFTGYHSSEEQLKRLPMAEASEILDPVVEKIHWQPAPGDADARSFFVMRFLSAGPERAEWWVKERLVILSEHAGTPALVPKLVALAQDKSNESSALRTREYAVNALAALAGFDARLDAHGTRLPVDEIATAYARACRQ